MCVFKCSWVYKIQEMCEFKCTCVYKIQEMECVNSSVPGCTKYRKWNVCIQVYQVPGCIQYREWNV